MLKKSLSLLLIFVSIIVDVRMAGAEYSTCADAYLAKNYASAFSLCKTEVSSGEDTDGWPQYYLSMMYRLGQGVRQDDSEGFNWALLSAKLGNWVSMYLVATDYAFNKGVSQDDRQALIWLSSLVRVDLKEAESLLAWFYDTGRGVTRDAATATKLYLLAAQQGDPDAQLRLSARYWGGVGVLQDYVEAHKWANLARSQGHSPIPQYLQELASLMTASQIEQAQKLAREWTPRERDPKAAAFLAPFLFPTR